MDIKELSPELQKIVKDTSLKIKKKIFNFDEVKAIYLTWENINKKKFAKAIHSEVATCWKIFNALQDLLQNSKDKKISDKDIQYIVEKQGEL